MLNKIKHILIFTFIYVAFALGLSAQPVTIKGKVTDPGNAPVTGAVVTVAGAKSSVITDESGQFAIETENPGGTITVSAEGFFELTQPLQNRREVNIVVIEDSKYKYNEDLLLPFRNVHSRGKTSSAMNINRKDLRKTHIIENTLQGEVSGLNVINKSGMPGEGSYINLRGTRSLIADNAPLVVINRVPYLPDVDNSPIIGGYSRGLFNSFGVQDIRNITVLKGAEASIYGSMGSNGVILVETGGAAGEALDTRISFAGQYGVAWNNRRLPVLGVEAYKDYLSDIGMTNYSDMQKLLDNFPFLADNPGYYYNYLYNNNTDWQDEIFSSSMVSDNVLRVEGGDAIARYDIALGYMKNGGTLGDTKTDRYHTQINSNIMISRKLEMFASVGLAYMQGEYQEQGMIEETNPVLVAYNKAPVLSPYKKDPDGSILASYDIHRYGVSNPVAIINTLVAKNRQYNVDLSLGLNYKPTDNLTVTGLVGLYYDYNKENIFIPGVTYQTIIPLNYSLAENTVRVGVAETKNMYYNINAAWTKALGDNHLLNVFAGGQIVTSGKEYDAGTGYNTANDYYQTLNYVTSGTEEFYGYINEWNWMNYYAHADYTWNDLVKTSLNMAVDASSASGDDASRFGVFPSGSITLMMKNLKGVLNSSMFNRFDLRAEYGLTGNSRFSSNYGKSYYRSAPYMTLSGIVRATIPNTGLKWEETSQLNLGLDLSLFRNRLDLTFDYYNSKSTDVLFEQPVMSVYGNSSYYDNSVKIDNHGLELSLLATVIKSKDVEWNIGGNIAIPKSKVKSLGTLDEIVTELYDGAEVITRAGEKPYNFYGYKATGIFASTVEAETSGLTDWRGLAYNAGDVRYQDVKSDKTINNEDKQLLGSAMPDYFGGFNTSLRVRNFTLSADFTYSMGNEAYNAVRRSVEAMADFNNQSQAVVNRWRFEGQVTDIPRAVYGDPMDNNTFSSRWIEDASYLKLKNVTLSYRFDKKFLNFFRSGTIYVTGENLYTWTDYLGLDPEFSYSYSEILQGVDYAKVTMPRTVKFGFNLQF